MSPKNEKEREEMKNIPYQNAVGSLMYAMTGTHPDIAYAVGAVSAYNLNPGMMHWKVVKRIICYLREHEVPSSNIVAIKEMLKGIVMLIGPEA